MNKKILLVEPNYKSKYPPLGLMKISTYHKGHGDEVVFFKGTDATLRGLHWDKIYISTMFTFQWQKTIETIHYYQKRPNKNNIVVGGILASLLSKELERETGIVPHVGLWDTVDRLPPDYNLFQNVHDYDVNNASFAYMTKGCINTCKFCAVPNLEPVYISYIPLKHQLNPNKKDLILLDNNVLASDDFYRIIEEIKSNGFHKDAKFGKARRHVDFNQGIDARLLTEEKMEALSQIALRPLRIAFDDIKFKNLYTEKIRLANKYGINKLSNYILFNYKDTPEDFYERLKINVELNSELNLDIFSFPMKYVPLDAKDRKHIGEHWTKTELRGIQCILHATHGIVGPKKVFFDIAFGHSADEFKHIIQQPEEYIFNRNIMPVFKKNQLMSLASASG